MQKQSFINELKNACSDNFDKIPKKECVVEIMFSKTLQKLNHKK